VCFSALAGSTDLPHIPCGSGHLPSAQISAGGTRRGFGSRGLHLSLRGGSAPAVDVESAVEEPTNVPTSSEERQAETKKADFLSFLNQDPNDALAQADAEAAGAKTPPKRWCPQEEEDLASRLDAISDEEKQHRPAAPAWDAPTGAPPAMPVPMFDPAGEMKAALERGDETASTGAQKYFDETGINITATAGAIAANRAAVTAMNHSYMDDPYAAKFAKAVCPDKLHAAMRKSEAELARFAVRTKYFDEFVRDAVLNRGITQIVIIGVGFDARALRAVDLRWDLVPTPSALDELEGRVLTIFEIDHPEVLSAKQRMLASVGADPVSVRGFGLPLCRRIPADVVGEDWVEALRVHGFSPNLPSAFLLEGVLYYYPERQVMRLLREIDEISSPGSRLGFSAVSKAASKPTGHWEWGVDDPEALLDKLGYIETKSVTLGDPEIAHGWDMSSLVTTGPKKTLYVTGSKAPAVRNNPEKIKDAVKGFWTKALPALKWTRWFLETALTTGHQLRIPFPKWIQTILRSVD